MSDRTPLHGLDDEALGRAVGALDLAWPASSPTLAEDVTTGIGERQRRSRRRSRRRVVLLVAAAVLVLATAALAARYVFDLGAIRIEPAPTGRPLPTASALPELGERVTLARAEALTGTVPDIPAGLGPPDRVWIDEPLDQPSGAAPTQIVMAWRPTEDLPPIPGSPYGAVLIRWDAHVAYGVKLVGEQVELVEVRGWPEAYWVSDPHELVVFTDDGSVGVLVRGQVLLWGDEQTTFRLETALSRHAAVAIADSTP